MSEDSFFDTMLYFFPDAKQDYIDSIEFDGERLNTVVIEEVSNCNNQVIRNAFEVTVLEVLDIDKNILAIARQYMGLKTAELQSKVSY